MILQVHRITYPTVNIPAWLWVVIVLFVVGAVILQIAPTRRRVRWPFGLSCRSCGRP